MSEAQWPHTLHISLNLGKPDSSILPVMASFLILDVPVLKPNIPVFTG
jgi:hypothetical protein